MNTNSLESIWHVITSFVKKAEKSNVKREYNEI